MSDYMKTKIAVIGCCATRDVFRSYYNNYKADYELEIDLLRTSMFSILQKPIKLKKDDLTFVPQNKNDYKKEEFHKRNIFFMKDDLIKHF